MISAIQSNQIFNIVLMLVYAIVVRIYSFLHPQLYIIKDNDTVLAKMIMNFVGQNPLVHSVVALLICYVIAILLSNVANNSRLFNRQNLYPGLFFILLSGFLVEFQTLSPALLAILFVTLFVISILSIYRNHYSGFAIFNVGLSAITASLLYPPFMTIIVTALISIGYFNGISLRDYLKFIFGVCAIIMITLSLFFFFDQSTSPFSSHFGLSEYLLARDYWSIDRITYGGILSFSLIIGVLNYYSNLKKKVIDARKKISFFYIMLVTLIIVPLVFNASEIHFLYAVAILAAYFLTLLVDYHRNIVLTEFIHIVILVLLFGFQFNFISI